MLKIGSRIQYREIRGTIESIGKLNRIVVFVAKLDNGVRVLGSKYQLVQAKGRAKANV